MHVWLSFNDVVERSVRHVAKRMRAEALGSGTMKFGAACLAAVILSLTAERSLAFEEDGCEKQRKQYPKIWNDVSKEKIVYRCYAHYLGSFIVRIGETDRKGRTQMSIQIGSHERAATIKEVTIYRMWLHKEQLKRLREGKYFATVVRKESSCWVRGDLDDDLIFFMDNTEAALARPDADNEGGYFSGGSFGAFGSNSIECEPGK